MEVQGTHDTPGFVKNEKNKQICLKDFRSHWELLPIELQHYILGCLSYEDLFRMKHASKEMKELVESNPSQATFITPYFYFHDWAIQWMGFDVSMRKWTRLPPLMYSSLPLPPGIYPSFRAYVVHANGGLLCINDCRIIGKYDEDIIDKNNLKVFNPLIGRCMVLPPLNYQRCPILMHMLVDSTTQSFKVIVAGSCSMRPGFEDFDYEQHDYYRMTEVFDSCTSKWETRGELPGEEHGFKYDFQTGMYAHGNLFCVASTEHNRSCILAYNVEQGKWLPNWMYSLPKKRKSLQLVQCSGQIYLYSQQEDDKQLYFKHFVDKVGWSGHRASVVSWKLENIIQSDKEECSGSWIYDLRWICVPLSESQLCIFHEARRVGMVYDIQDGHSREPQVFEGIPPSCPKKDICILNPISFQIDLSFIRKVPYHHGNNDAMQMQLLQLSLI
jgi:hypothetical protein